MLFKKCIGVKTHITNYRYFNGKHTLTIHGGIELTISRSWKEAFFQRFRTL